MCGRIGAKIGFSASATCGIWPATMIMPQMVHSAAIVAMSGKGVVEGLVEQVEMALKAAVAPGEHERQHDADRKVGMICHLNTMIMSTGKTGTM